MPDSAQMQMLINTLGWTLIHFLWQGLGIACVYWLVCRLTRPLQSAVRYWAGMLAFLAAIVIPVVTFSLYWPDTGEPGTSELFVTSMAPVSSSMDFSFVRLLRLSMEPVLAAVVMLWAAGVIFLSVRAMMGWMGAHRLVTLDTEEIDACLRRVVAGLADSLGVRQAVMVLKSGRVRVPTVVGWIRPVILLPAAVIAQLPRDQLEMVIAHELVHVRRYDYLFNMLQLVVETLFFYNPAIRWMSRQVRQEREHCCDDLVVAQCGRPVLYAKALANLEILREPMPAVALSASGGDLVQRVRRIVRHELPQNHSGFAQLATMIAVAAMISVGAHQGLEMQRQITEQMLASEASESRNRVTGSQNRLAWVNGVNSYSRQAAEQSKRAAEELAAQAAGETRLIRETVGIEQQEPAAVDSQNTEIPALGSVSENSENIEATGNTEELFEMPAPFEENSDEALMLASSSLPSAMQDSAAGRTERIAGQSKSKYSIKPEKAVAPVYPFKARRKNLDGFVRLEFSVNPQGKPRDIRVVDAQPADIFEKAAIQALEQWQFRIEQGFSDNQRLTQMFEFGMEQREPVTPGRERRCDITGSRICGLKPYNSK